jgi:hypothetical protein
MSKTPPATGRATLLVATVASGKWFQSGTNRFDFVLEVRPDDGSPSFRAQVSNLRIYQAKAQPGIDVAVEFDPVRHDVTILWRGDPNLDMDAWRTERQSHDEQQRLDALRDITPDAGQPA